MHHETEGCVSRLTDLYANLKTSALAFGDHYEQKNFNPDARFTHEITCFLAPATTVKNLAQLDKLMDQLIDSLAGDIKKCKPSIDEGYMTLPHFWIIEMIGTVKSTYHFKMKDDQPDMRHNPEGFVNGEKIITSTKSVLRQILVVICPNKRCTNEMVKNIGEPTQITTQLYNELTTSD